MGSYSLLDVLYNVNYRHFVCEFTARSNEVQVQESVNILRNVQQLVAQYKKENKRLSELILDSKKPSNISLRDWAQLLKNTWVASN